MVESEERQKEKQQGGKTGRLMENAVKGAVS
jgi:hypothetical protein